MRIGNIIEVGKTRLVEDVRRLPRELRLAQGFARIRDMVAHVATVQQARRELRQRAAERPLARVVEEYQALLDADLGLRRAARRAAGCDPHDACPVVVCYRQQRQRPIEFDGRPRECGSSYVKYHWHNHGARGTVYHPSTRRVVVGIDWVRRQLRAAGAEEVARG